MSRQPAGGEDRLSKARIAVVSPFVDKRHGTERCLAEQLERLSREYEIHLFSSRVEDTDLSAIQWHRVPEIPGPHLVKYLFWFAANHVCRWRVRRSSGRPFDLIYSPGINCLDAGVIHIHIVFAEFFHYVRSSLRLMRNPFRSWPRLIHRRLYYHLIIALERRLYTRSDVLLVGISQKTRQDLLRFYGANGDVPIVYHGVDTCRFSPERRRALRDSAREQLGLTPETFAVLLVGNDWKRKGLDCLWRAMRKLGRPRLRLLIRGEDDPAPYERDWNTPDAVPVTLLPSREDVEFYYAAADLLVAPSLEDTFSLPPLEAMGSGLPVIVSRKAGVSEIVTHGQDALVLEDPNDADDLARLIGHIYDHESLRRELSEQAVVTARRFTWDTNAEHMKALFDRSLAGKTSQPQTERS
jgi:glycosyltransferase involved in cell wall biosynthesis